MASRPVRGCPFLLPSSENKLLTPKKATDLLGWKHSGFNLDAGEAPVAGDDVEGRRRLAEYLLRAPFSLQKTTWNKETATVIYRSGHHWKTKRNFEIFSATDFLAAAVEHIPDRYHHTIRYYGLYSNKSRGVAKKRAASNAQTVPSSPPPNASSQENQAPPPETVTTAPPTNRQLRPL